ncbi:MAG: DUF6515 family protein [Psychroserpens sp.]|uniref:DUF6515 family protein n=1 Tax=Psychroserpens sp. TaxID=2020870 RepID=UPI0030014694
MITLKKTLGISLLLCLFLFPNQIVGQKRNTTKNRSVKTEKTHTNDRVSSTHNRHNDRYRTQPIRRSPHFRYPRHRRVIGVLPRHHVRLVYGGLPYYYYSGIYYTMYGDQYIVVMPPRGFRITVLPVGYTRIVIGPSIYFYHSGVYYSESSTNSTESEGNYEVSQPPVGIVLNDIHEDSEKVVIDGKILYEYNDVLYKKNTNLEGSMTYEVVYSKSNND